MENKKVYKIGKLEAAAISTIMIKCPPEWEVLTEFFKDVYETQKEACVDKGGEKEQGKAQAYRMYSNLEKDAKTLLNY